MGNAFPAPSTHPRPLQIGAFRAFAALRRKAEQLLEAERSQLVLWLPVALGAGVAGWFGLAGPYQWCGLILCAMSVAALGLTMPGRSGRMLLVGGAAVASGCALMWWRAEIVAAPVLARPSVVSFEGRVYAIEALPARDIWRIVLAPEARPDLPPRVRVNVPTKEVPQPLEIGARLSVRARLMPPAAAAVPGGYDFARAAWFVGLGATGRAIGPVKRLDGGSSGKPPLRARLSEHIQHQVSGSAGGIASALATGDRGAIAEPDAEAMRRSGLAHLLSVSGLHVTAVTGAAMMIVLKLLALSPTLALRWRLPLVAAGAGALAAIGYTWLTGAQVPTIRSCIAALLVLLAIALGREALTLRLVAAGATVVLLFWPEALIGPSFQLSFAAVTAIVVLHESPRMRRWFERREEGRAVRLLRGAASLLLTGIVVELALMPIALFHFHKAGLYGALANIVAIPLTTFVVMPAEALALFLDLVGLGAPLWWLVSKALALLLALAHTAASAPGALATLPAMPAGAFVLMVFGGLWIGLWRTGLRFAGLVPFTLGAAWGLASPSPDLLVTGDGRHLAIRMPDGAWALLRDRAGDFTRATLGENGGVEPEHLQLMTERPEARCSADACIVEHRAGGRRWRIAATRSSYAIDWPQLIRLCAASDIVVSDRRLPPPCKPRWQKLDRPALERSGGVAINLRTAGVRTVRSDTAHPWIHPPTVKPRFEQSRASRP
ncbi:ComEC/Rec2 family competence protein [Sphingomonas sp. RS6]